MGKNNEQRRAAKRRQRQRRARSGASARAGATAGEARGGSYIDTEQLIRSAAWHWDVDPRHHDAVLDVLVARGRAAADTVDRLLREAVDDLWRRGWTPADLVHVTSRRLSASHADLAAAVAVADGRERERAGQGLHHRWSAQLAVLTERGGGQTGRLLDGEFLRLGLTLLASVWRLGDVLRTVPPPGEPAEVPVPDGGLDERILGRVRALLSKAESTTFDEEAEALTAKAQELIARHAIDEALLHALEDVGEPSVRRIRVDDPYADAKMHLVVEVAGANRCRAVLTPDYGWVTVFGYEHDLDAVELLGASLLAQATGAMARSGSRRDAHGRSRTRSFRRAFLLGFAQRVGERLRAATERQMAATEADDDRLLPVLSAREDRLREAVAAAFPHVVHKSSSVGNAGGWVAGRAAADLADLDVSSGAIRTDR